MNPILQERKFRYTQIEMTKEEMELIRQLLYDFLVGEHLLIFNPSNVGAHLQTS